MGEQAVACRFKFGERAPMCGEPAITEVEMTLPEWVADGVRIAENQRRQKLPVCATHKALIDSLTAPGVFSVGKEPAIVRSTVPIDNAHRSHRAYVPGCHGCALDFDPPW